MTRGSAHGLTTAPCTAEPDAMFPGRSPHDIEHAKSFCRRCPAINRCLQWALDTHTEDGVWGGLSEGERRNLRRTARRRQLDAEAVAAKAEQARQAAKPRTMRSVFDDGTTRLHGGHLAWTGPKKVHFRGQVFTPKQFAFTLDRGHAPNGRVTAECGISDCVLPQHLADTAERTRCGTRSGYERHRARGEEACRRCKRANADADNRLRWTGTTKVAV